MDGRKERWVCGWVDELMGEFMDGKMDELMKRWVNG